METTYTHETTARRSGGARTRRAVGRNHARARTGMALAPKERRRLVQLCICAALFALVFFGRGILPGKMENARGELLSLLHTDTDFRAAFASLGQSVSGGEPVVETLGSLWVDVFMGEKRTPMPDNGSIELPAYEAERVFLASSPTAGEVLARRSDSWMKETAPQVPVPAETVTPTPAPAPIPTKTPADTLPAQPQPVYTGATLPEGATMDMVDLGIAQTVAPVMAEISSTYGWREHPIAGGEKFHSGVDLAADYGSAIGAFADGTVDYIGESPAYGQYLQIKHADGVTTFYAHCSKLCVQQGQKVSRGDKVAEVGNTGNVTGTHLHFELKKDGKFLNPLNYIQTLSP